MPEVNVEINGKKYRMACEPGQEEHLLGLAGEFNARVEQFKQVFGEIGDIRLTVMAGIALIDELSVAQERIEALSQHAETLTQAGQSVAAEMDELEAKFARRLNDAARKIEAISAAIDEAGSPAGN
jgi:cell division protein ZapA